MRKNSSLTPDQRATALALFEQGYRAKAVANRLGSSTQTTQRLLDRWRIHGREALTQKMTRRQFTFEEKREVVRRFQAGETKVALCQAFNLSDPELVQRWHRQVLKHGEDALRPQQQGRPRKVPPVPGSVEEELAQLREENAYLKAENAYLGKLSALRRRCRRG